ncbi:hypothetical protein CW689_05370 [Macrococcoides caseolyticum]|uniref:hypothetical protein n=1 Tax=Macrococcoides caseolyticum TaxID=69966 RepID=UPI000C32BE98|nr:hypothetical protein [Macrococcus caseolyticus]PKE24146.1 hypothetical protein CW689_05370 [Macrococcus caseolyticus]
MKHFYNAKDVMELLDCSKSYAHSQIRRMNEEMEKDGFYSVRGKVPVKKFEEKFPYLKGASA